jgi:alpha-D-ribose 1-methylphosphonate 5-triphosphate synthase subunit PhnG
MAQATERSQMVAMRANFVQKCGRPDFRATLAVCDPEHVASYVEKMADNYNVLRHLHQGLYLVRGSPGGWGQDHQGLWSSWCCWPYVCDA